MLFTRSWRIGPVMGLILLMAGCAPASGSPKSEPSATAQPSPPPTMLPVQNTPTAETVIKFIIDTPSSGNAGGVESLAFSPDGKVLASMYKSGGIILWDAATRQNIRSFAGGAETGGLGMTAGLAFTPDGKSLVAKVNGLTITLWDVAASQSVDVVRDLAHGNGMTLSPDGTLLAYGQCAKLGPGSRCSQYGIILWDAATRQPVGQPLRFDVAASAPLWLLFSPDSQTLAVMSSGTTGSGKIELFDVVTRQSIETPMAGEVQFTSMAFSPDGKYIALGSISGVIYIWDVNSHQVISQLNGEKGLVTGILFSPNGKTLASRILIPGADPKEKIVLWDMDSLSAIGQPLTGQFGAGRETGLISMSISPDGRILATGTGDGVIILWDLAALRHSS